MQTYMQLTCRDDLLTVVPEYTQYIRPVYICILCPPRPAPARVWALRIRQIYCICSQVLLVI